MQEWDEKNRQDIGLIALFALVCVGVFWWVTHTAVRPDPGQSAPNDPLQTEVQGVRPWMHKGFFIKPLARYDITGRIVHRQDYHFDEVSNIAPLDLALAWGPVSDPANYQKIRFSQDGRWVEYNYDANLPASVASRLNHCTSNNHLIPATDEIRGQLMALRVNETVRLKGYLIEASKKGGVWRSSLSRDDSRGGACEVMWVESVEVLP